LVFFDYFIFIFGNICWTKLTLAKVVFAFLFVFFRICEEEIEESAMTR